jgi:hypothetical protein
MQLKAKAQLEHPSCGSCDAGTYSVIQSVNQPKTGLCGDSGMNFNDES